MLTPVNLKGTLAERLSDPAFAREYVDALNEMLKEDEKRIAKLEAALRKVRAYNVDIAAGRINYRPEDHIAVIDAALSE